MKQKPGSESSLSPVSVRYWSNLLFALAMAMILTLFVAGYYQATTLMKSLTTYRQQSLQVDAVDNLLINLLDVETGVRGYLLSGNREYIESYAEAVATLDYRLIEVDNSLDQHQYSNSDDERLMTLIKEYKMVFNELVENKQEGQRFDKAEMYAGKLVFDEARDILSGIKTKLTFDRSAFYNEAAQVQFYIKWAGFTLCAAALALLLWLFSILQKQAKLKTTITRIMSQENERLEHEVSLRTAQLTGLAAQLTQVSEAEKNKLARELHDDMGASLTAAKMDASWIASQQPAKDDEKMHSKLIRLIGSLDHAITLKRRLTNDLLPPLLSELGLNEALRSLAEDVQNNDNLNVVIRLPGRLPDIDRATSLALFRICQESITNVRKYAQASTLVLTLKIEKNNLVFEITDDGIGFDVATTAEESFGLISMQHRAKMIGGSFNIHTEMGTGTTIEVIVPLDNETE